MDGSIFSCATRAISTRIAPTNSAGFSAAHPSRARRWSTPISRSTSASTRTPRDKVVVIATQPLTRDETWHQCRPGELSVFGNGEPLQIGGGLPDRGTLAGRVCVLAGGSGGIGAVLARALHAGWRPARHRLSPRARSRRGSGDGAPCRRARRRSPSSEATWRAKRRARRAAAAARALGDPYGLVVLAGDPARPAGAAPTQGEIEASLADNYVGPGALARSFATDCSTATAGGAIVLVSTMQEWRCSRGASPTPCRRPR